MTSCALPAAQDEAQPVAPALAYACVEVLGALAPCDASGPHGREAVRRRTRLVPTDFDHAVQDLAGRGWLFLDGPHLWVTRPGEEVVHRLFA